MRANNGRAVIKVADNGMGMSPEVMENIFIPFFSTKKNGSGIGLSLCKQILLLHKGNIQVQSVEGVGRRFIYTFRARVMGARVRYRPHGRSFRRSIF